MIMMRIRRNVRIIMRMMVMKIFFSIKNNYTDYDDNEKDRDNNYTDGTWC